MPFCPFRKDTDGNDEIVWKMSLTDVKLMSIIPDNRFLGKCNVARNIKVILCITVFSEFLKCVISDYKYIFQRRFFWSRVDCRSQWSHFPQKTIFHKYSVSIDGIQFFKVKRGAQRTRKCGAQRDKSIFLFKIISPISGKLYFRRFRWKLPKCSPTARRAK